MSAYYSVEDVAKCYELTRTGPSGTFWSAKCRAAKCETTYEVEPVVPSAELPIDLDKQTVHNLMGHQQAHNGRRRFRRVR